MEGLLSTVFVSAVALTKKKCLPPELFFSKLVQIWSMGLGKTTVERLFMEFSFLPVNCEGDHPNVDVLLKWHKKRKNEFEYICIGINGLQFTFIFSIS